MVFLEFDESEQQPEDTGADEYADYAELAAYSDEGQDENQKSAQINLSEVFRPGLGIPECKQDKADACGTDERDNSRAQSVQDAADRTNIAVFEEEPGKNDAEDQRWRNKAKSCCDSAAKTSHFHAGEGSCVDADRSRCHLRDGENINEFAHAQPVIGIDDAGLDKRHGCIAAADTEDADFDEFPEKQ